MVDNLSLEIKEGEIFGLLGANGAGKSTTMNMICSLIKPKLLIFEECDVMETRKIGLVGGTGPESTVMYYKELNSKIDRMSEGKVMPDIAIESVNFRKAWDIMTAGDYESLSDYLSEKVNALKVTGSEVIALTAVTMHVVYDAVQKKTGVLLVSIPKAVSDEAAERGFKKVGLLGTIFTMEQDFMKNDFLQAGIEVVVPDSEDRQLVARRIYEELEFGIVKESTLKEFNDLILKMQNEHGIEAVVLGCTELPLLLNNDNCVLPCLDSVAIHINEVIELAISDD
ncbi:MAG: amino acid racemase [Clostridia bacterium]|nr:amino acid racemase [Clostridia bacterium]